MNQPKKNLDNTSPIEPGCPHCGHGGAHPNSSHPVTTTVPTKVVISAPSPPLSLGQICYERWVVLVGHTDFAVPWDKLGIIGKNAWIGAAGEVGKHVLASALKIPQASPRAAIAQAIVKKPPTIS